MEIVEKDFKLTSVGKDSLLWDLSLLQIVNKGKSNERKEFKITGYGLTLDRALTIAAHSRIFNKYEDQEINLKTYRDEFRKIKKEIEDLCNNTINLEKI